MDGQIEKLNSRIEELEVRYMHQQSWIDDLNQVVREQSEMITRLRLELERVKETFTTVVDVLCFSHECWQMTLRPSAQTIG